MGKKLTRTSIVFIAVAICIVTYFYRLSNKTREEEQNPTTATLVQEVLLSDISKNYPATPKEVLKYYNKILECFYNETYTNEELAKLAQKAQEVYDDELVENQTSYLSTLKKDIEQFKKDDGAMSSYSLSAATDVDYYSIDGFNFAKLNCMYSIRKGTKMQATNEVYLLRKDDSGHWKIYGWELDNNKDEK